MSDQPETTIVERYSAHLARRASGIVNRWTAVLALLCGGLGAVPLSSWASWPLTHQAAYGTTLLGVVCGAVLGRSIGASRAAGLRLQAQLVLHQDERGRAALELARAAGHLPAAPAEAPVPVVPVAAEPPVSAPPAPASAPVVRISVAEQTPVPAPPAPAAVQAPVASAQTVQVVPVSPPVGF